MGEYPRFRTDIEVPWLDVTVPSPVGGAPLRTNNIPWNALIGRDVTLQFDLRADGTTGMNTFLGEGLLHGRPATGKHNIGPKWAPTAAAVGLSVLALAACGGLPGSGPERACGTYRMDLGPRMVAAVVGGLTPGMPEKVAYVTDALRHPGRPGPGWNGDRAA